MVVPEWYCGRSVMVTGGMGFMGKVLLEKLLYSCSDIRAIYVLARAKRGVSPAARLEEITKLPLFERIQKEKPEVLKKLVAVESDITMEGLGVQDDVLRQRLLEEVNVVFHLAASLRLEAGLKAAVLNNTLSTKYVLDFCLAMKNLQTFLHLSTAFCHCDYEELEEKMYPPPAKPHDVIHLVQWLDEKSIELITPRLLGPHPNSYTYSKRLAEYLVYEYKDKLPVCIARPSIVLPAMKEPMPGWVDTLNGPVGVLVGGGKGVIHSMLCGKDYAVEAVPVDVAINILICIAQRLACKRVQTKEDVKEDMPIYNLSSGAVCRVSWDEILRKGKETIHEYPFDYGIWYPNGKIRTNQFIHWLCVFFLHIVPAYFLDVLLFITRNKRFMVRLQKRISTGLEVLQHFTTRDWFFHNEQALETYNSLSKEDKEIFPVPQSDINIDEYMKNAILGARVYCMKEPLSSLPRARRHLKLLYCIDCLMKILLYGFLFWLIWRQLDSIKFILDYPAHALRGLPLFDTFLKHYK